MFVEEFIFLAIAVEVLLGYVDLDSMNSELQMTQEAFIRDNIIFFQFYILANDWDQGRVLAVTNGLQPYLSFTFHHADDWGLSLGPTATLATFG